MENESTKSFTSLRMPALRATEARLVLGIESGIPCADPLVSPLHEVDTIEFRRSSVTQARLAGSSLTIQVADSWMSLPHSRMFRNGRGWQLEDAGSKNGTHLNGSRIDSEPLFDGDVLELGSSFFVFNAAVPLQPRLETGLRAILPRSQSSALCETYEQLHDVARSSLPVLVLGETGTGKELAANLVHQWSQRPGEFCAVNCAAIAAPLAESSLFGHKKGAFSGAVADHPGLVRAADGGTLFLDEIAELDLALQAKLLRVLQEGEVLAVGSNRPTPVDFRLVCATHADLDALVATGRFRQDLLARVAGHRAILPPLRHRKEDIGLLIHDLLAQQLGGAARGVELERRAARAIYAYEWPNNIRELSHAVQLSTALRSGRVISLEQLPPVVQQANFESERRSEPPASADDDTLRARLIELLTRYDGNVSAVAREMDKARVQIRRWCTRLDIDLERFRAE